MKRTDLLDSLSLVKDGIYANGGGEQMDCFIFTKNNITTSNGLSDFTTPSPLNIEGAVKGNELITLLSKITAADIDVSVVKNELRVKGKRFNSGIALEDITEDIDLSHLKRRVKYKDLPKGFSEGVRRCMFSTKSEKSGSVLACINAKDNFVEACDEERASRCRMKSTIEDQLLIPPYAFKPIIDFDFKQYGISSGQVFMKNEERQIIFSFPLNDGTYPDIGESFKGKGNRLLIPDELNLIIDRGGIFTSKEDLYFERVKVQLTKTKCTIKGENESGWYEEDISIKTKIKNDISFQIHPHVLKDILKVSNRCLVNKESMIFRAKNFTHVIALTPVYKDE